MNNQEILDSAPKGATHVEVLTDYKKIYYYRRCYKDFCNKFMYDVYQQGTWYICSDISGEFRSLSDIAKLVELEIHIQSLKVINEYIDEGCPGMQVIRSEIGGVISRVEGTYLKALKELK